MFIDEVKGVNREITDEATGRVCNLAINPQHPVDKYLTTEKRLPSGRIH